MACEMLHQDNEFSVDFFHKLLYYIPVNDKTQ